MASGIMEHHTTRAFRKPYIRRARNRDREIHFHTVCQEKGTISCTKQPISTNDEVWGCTRSMGKRGQRERERREGGVRALPGLLCMTNLTIYHASKPPSDRASEREGERPDHKRRRRRGELMHHLFAAPPSLLGTNGRSPSPSSSSERSDDPTSRRPSAPRAHRPSGERKASMEVYGR